MYIDRRPTKTGKLERKKLKDNISEMKNVRFESRNCNYEFSYQAVLVSHNMTGKLIAFSLR